MVCPFGPSREIKKILSAFHNEDRKKENEKISCRISPYFLKALISLRVETAFRFSPQDQPC